MKLMDLQNEKLSISARELVKEYGKRRVVNGVNLNLKAGEVVGLLGLLHDYGSCSRDLRLRVLGQ